MILQALKDYYDRKAADPESGIAPLGWERKEIPYLIVLDRTGRLVTVEDTQEKIGRKPFFLAGGISPENMERAAEAFRPYALDLSSSVETDGVKDPEKIRKLMETIRKRGTE